MNNVVLNSEIQKFINLHLDSNVHSLLLKGSFFESIETIQIIEQIEAKNKCKNKLTTWYNTENIYYPNKLNIEQTSSEITARYKSQLISGNTIIDITGGFGVDCYFFSKQFKEVTHCEINKKLSSIVNHNFKQLAVNNIITKNIDGIGYLKKSFDWIYVDPSRRHDSKGKVFFLKNCLPNIPEHLDVFFNHTSNILIKTSPLLDISIGINELKHVKTIHIIAVNNEVKELLWILEKNFNDLIIIKTVNIKKETQENFNFKLEKEANISLNYNHPLTYLYEPNAAILKAGAFKSVSCKFKVSKLHKHSHLYTSNELIDFPGRHFKINEVIPYSKKNIKKSLGSQNANITTRNFPETVSQIKHKFNIKDGGNLYVFFTTNIDNDKIAIITTKM